VTAKIVLLNGVGSAGKSSIAKALQAITAEPFLHVQMDTFLEMLPEALQDHAPGFTYETGWEDGKPSVAIKAGPVGKRVMLGMRHAIAAMARQGNNLIVDDVMVDGEMAHYQALLPDFKVFSVGVFASLDVLEPVKASVATDCRGWRAGSSSACIGASATTSRSTPVNRRRSNAPIASNRSSDCSAWHSLPRHSFIDRQQRR